MVLNLKATNKEASVTIDADTYDATYIDYEDFEGSTFGPAIKLKFVIEAADAGTEKPVDISGLASVPVSGYMGPKSKLRQWAEGIMGRKLADDEGLNMNKLCNTPCRLMLEVVEKPKDDGTMGRYNKIVKVLPAKRRAQKPVGDEPF